MDKEDALKIAQRYASLVKTNYACKQIFLFGENDFNLSNPVVHEILKHGQRIDTNS